MDETIAGIARRKRAFADAARPAEPAQYKGVLEYSSRYEYGIR